MGCCKSRTIYSRTSAENQELIRFESTFQLQNISFQQLETIARRSSSASLSKVHHLLNTSFPIHIPVDFLENSSINHSDFLIFLILSGKGSSKEKSTALWYLFDSGLEQVMSKDLLLKLFKSVIKASVEIPVVYYLKKNSSALINAWHQQLNERTEGLEQKLMKHFLEDADSLTFDLFLAKCEEMPTGKICETSAVRTQLEHTQVIPKKFANPFRTMKVTKLTT
jgi:hypothetical protein